MTFFDRFEEWLFWIVTSIVGAIAAGVTWLIRTVFTNQKIIELHTREFEHRDQLRNEDRERMANIEAGVARIESVLLGGDRHENGE